MDNIAPVDFRRPLDVEVYIREFETSVTMSDWDVSKQYGEKNSKSTLYPILSPRISDSWAANCLKNKMSYHFNKKLNGMI